MNKFIEICGEMYGVSFINYITPEALALTDGHIVAITPEQYAALHNLLRLHDMLLSVDDSVTTNENKKAQESALAASIASLVATPGISVFSAPEVPTDG